MSRSGTLTEPIVAVSVLLVLLLGDLMTARPIATWSPVDQEWLLTVPGRRDLTPQADLDAPSLTGRVCPFCPGGAEAGSTDAPRLIPSKHPMIIQSPTSGTATQVHWIVVYGNYHDRHLGDLPVSYLQHFLLEVSKKSEELLGLSNVNSVFAFESVGDHFGPTIAHPHGQIVGLTFTPRRLVAGSDADHCTLCNLENHSSLRIIELPGASLYVPPWSRFPFEMIASPREHRAHLAGLSASTLIDLAQCVHTALNLCRATYGGKMPPYLVNVMAAHEDNSCQHVRIEVVPLHKDAKTLKRPGGMELGLGVYLNPVPPIAAAETLRAALVIREL
jgi:UDPglucose--hexose-1-phosphate uridylyltransferase